MNPIALVISDVDGTLVTPDKRLTAAAIEAVKKLRRNDIAFTITSSRPPFGMRMLVDPLGLSLPMGAFNGSSIVEPSLAVVEQHFIPKAAVLTSIDVLTQAGVDIWLFTNERWLIMRDDGHYVSKEHGTIEADPVVVGGFSDFMETACKIVGVSGDADKLRNCEIHLQGALGGRASAVCSQRYYLDVTPANLDKGTFADALAKRLGIATDRIATIGDMQNDLAMFGRSGLSFAMGNATPEVQARATYTSKSNEDDGFAAAVEHIIAL